MITVKEYQRDFPLDLPFTNPSMFQSPGGRKFVSFLHVFSRFVVKVSVEKQDNGLLSKPLVKNGKYKKISYIGLMKCTRGALEDAFIKQCSVEEIVRQSKESINRISIKYFDIKSTLEDKRNNQYIQQSKVEKEELLHSYEARCATVKQLISVLKNKSAAHENLWDDILSVVDDSMQKPKLNFKQLPTQLVASEDLIMTYVNMIRKVLSTADRSLQFKPQSLPIQVV